MSRPALSKAILAGAVGASFFLEASSAAPAIESTQACASFQASGINPTETLAMPPTLESNQEPQLLTPLGGIAVKKSELTINGGDLPEPYQDALAYSLVEPFTGCMIARHAHGGIEVYQWRGPENGEVPPGSDMIGLLLTDDPSESRAFTTPEAIRRTLTHEATHVFLNAWVNAANSGNTAAQKALTDLNEAYATKLEATFETLRQEHGAAIAKTITNLGTELTARGQSIATSAAQELLVRLSQPNGLQDLATFCPPDTAGGCQMNSLTDMLGIITEQRGGEPLDRIRLDMSGIDIGPLDATEEVIQLYMQRHFSISDESNIFGVAAWIGHPAKNTSEYAASIVAVDQNDPSTVLQRLHELSPAERTHELRMRQAIVEGITLIDPSLLRFMQTVGILEKLDAAL